MNRVYEAKMEVEPLKIVQISDIHMFADEEKDLLGVKTQKSFVEIVNFVKQTAETPNLILLTGDLSQDGLPKSYQEIGKLISEIGVPVYYVPGNHDDISNLDANIATNKVSKEKNLVFKNWQLILLNSKKPKSVEGYLAEDQIEFLQKCIRKHPNLNAGIVFYHQPIPVGCAWLDKLGVQNADELWGCIDTLPQVKLILFGHVHQKHEGVRKGVKYFSVPSTSIQFKTKSDDFALENIPQGYRWIELYANGDIQTEVRRMQQYIGKFDPGAKGY